MYLGRRVVNSFGFAHNFLVLVLEVISPRKPRSPKQTEADGHPTCEREAMHCIAVRIGDGNFLRAITKDLLMLEESTLRPLACPFQDPTYLIV